MTAASTPLAQPTASSLAGKYLTFILSGERYGIPVLKVREIIRQTAITAVPQMPAYIKGVTNLRGKIIPVIDLCTRFGLERSACSENACVVFVQITGANHRPVQFGLAVDGVEEVCQFAPGDIEETPDFGAAVDTRCILGMAKSKGVVKTLLDIDKVITGDTLDLPLPAPPTA